MGIRIRLRVLLGIVFIYQHNGSRSASKIHDLTTPSKLPRFLISDMISIPLSGPSVQVTAYCHHVSVPYCTLRDIVLYQSLLWFIGVTAG